MWLFILLSNLLATGLYADDSLGANYMEKIQANIGQSVSGFAFVLKRLSRLYGLSDDKQNSNFLFGNDIQDANKINFEKENTEEHTRARLNAKRKMTDSVNKRARMQIEHRMRHEKRSLSETDDSSCTNINNEFSPTSGYIDFTPFNDNLCKGNNVSYSPQTYTVYANASQESDIAMQIYSNDCQYVLGMTNDGRLTIGGSGMDWLGNTGTWWTSYQNGYDSSSRMFRLSFLDSNGDIIIYDEWDNILWQASATTTWLGNNYNASSQLSSPYRIVLSEEMNAQVYDSNNHLIWHSDSATTSRYRVFLFTCDIKNAEYNGGRSSDSNGDNSTISQLSNMTNISNMSYALNNTSDDTYYDYNNLLYNSTYYTLVDFVQSNSLYIKTAAYNVDNTIAASLGYSRYYLPDDLIYRLKFSLYGESINDEIVQLATFPFEYDFSAIGEWRQLPIALTDYTFLCKTNETRYFILEVESMNSTTGPFNVTFEIDPCMFV